MSRPRMTASATGKCASTRWRLLPDSTPRSSSAATHLSPASLTLPRWFRYSSGVQPILYVYAIARAGHPSPERVEAVDDSDHVDVVRADSLCAFYSPVDAADFSQPVIDARSKDVEWLGRIG